MPTESNRCCTTSCAAVRACASLTAAPCSTRHKAISCGPKPECEPCSPPVIRFPAAFRFTRPSKGNSIGATSAVIFFPL